MDCSFSFKFYGFIVAVSVVVHQDQRRAFPVRAIDMQPLPYVCCDFSLADTPIPLQRRIDAIYLAVGVGDVDCWSNHCLALLIRLILAIDAR